MVERRRVAIAESSESDGRRYFDAGPAVIYGAWLQLCGRSAIGNAAYEAGVAGTAASSTAMDAVNDIVDAAFRGDDSEELVEGVLETLAGLSVLETLAGLSQEV